MKWRVLVSAPYMLSPSNSNRSAVAWHRAHKNTLHNLMEDLKNAG